MSIETRLNAINDHLVDDYSVLTLAGADLTNVDKNIINLKPTWKERLLYFMNNGTDVVWDNWEKVVGEGTSLTLNNTEQAPMKVLLKGNTYQDSTTGKQLFNTKLLTNRTFAGGINIVVDNEGKWNFNGTSTKGGVLSLRMTNTESQKYANKTIYYNTLNATEDSAGTFQLVVRNSDDSLKSYKQIGNTSSGSWDLTNESFSNGEYFEFFIYIAGSGTSFSNKQFAVMISDTENVPYEPYTGGIASPNPDYPQEVHVVSGDNEVEVVGKNLFDKDNSTFISKTIGSTTRWGYKLPKANNDFYVSKVAVSIGGYYIYEDVNGTMTALKEVKTTPQIITNSSNDFYMLCLSTSSQTTAKQYFDSDSFMVSYTNDTYTPYTSTTYPINLGVVNLIDFSTISYTSENDATVTRNGQEYTVICNSSTKWGSCRFYQTDLNLKPNTTYTFSALVKSTNSATGSYVMIYAGLNTTGSTIPGNKVGNGERSYATFTTPSEITGSSQCIGLLPTETSATTTFTDIMLEEGDKASSYTPYGTTPLWLGSIGDYKDRFFKTSGKNLLNGTIYQGMITQQGTYWSSTNRITNANSDTMKTFILKKGTYTLSIDNLNYCTVIIKDSAGNVVQDFANEWKSLPFTFTTTEEGYFYFTARKTDNSNISSSDYRAQLNEGETAPPYEPYGTNEWYLEKKIGKVVLDGSNDELWTAIGSYQRYSITIFDFSSPSTSSIANILCDKLVPTTKNNIAFTDNAISGGDENTNKFFVRINDTITTIELLKTFLSNNNLSVYYQLATPTYTKIEGTLASQLEATKRSYEEQTNISQTNNDLPFALDVSALKEI